MFSFVFFSTCLPFHELRLYSSNPATRILRSSPLPIVKMRYDSAYASSQECCATLLTPFTRHSLVPLPTPLFHPTGHQAVLARGQ